MIPIAIWILLIGYTITWTGKMNLGISYVPQSDGSIKPVGPDGNAAKTYSLMDAITCGSGSATTGGTPVSHSGPSVSAPNLSPSAPQAAPAPKAQPKPNPQPKPITVPNPGPIIQIPPMPVLSTSGLSLGSGVVQNIENGFSSYVSEAEAGISNAWNKLKSFL